MALLELRRSFIKKTTSFRKKKNNASPLKIDRITDLTEEDRDTFIDFKGRVFRDLQERHTDIVLLRFLKARSFNINDAEKLFYLDISLRRLLNIENIIDYEWPEVYSKYHPSGFIGFDNEGSPIRVFNIGNTDLKGLNVCLTSTELMKLLIWYLEHDAKNMIAENKKTGNKANNEVIIMNVENLSIQQVMHKPALDNCMQGLKILQDHFYDIVKTIYVINAPSFFATVYNILRPVIQENLHRRIKIMSDNWREELTKTISADVLPTYLGGRRVDCDKDPFCKKFIGFGGEIPETYYPSPDIFLSSEDPDVMTAIIPNGSFCHFRYPVFDVGTEILLHINSKEYDIGFGIFLEPLSADDESPCNTQSKKKDLAKLEQLFPIIRCQSHVSPEVRKIVAWKTGVYILHFDNTYSWMNSKKVLFKVKLESPEKKEVFV